MLRGGYDHRFYDVEYVLTICDCKLKWAMKFEIKDVIVTCVMQHHNHLQQILRKLDYYQCTNLKSGHSIKHIV